MITSMSVIPRSKSAKATAFSVAAPSLPLNRAGLPTKI
jgi:hypothetical protein